MGGGLKLRSSAFLPAALKGRVRSLRLCCTCPLNPTRQKTLTPLLPSTPAHKHNQYPTNTLLTKSYPQLSNPTQCKPNARPSRCGCTVTHTSRSWWRWWCRTTAPSRPGQRTRERAVSRAALGRGCVFWGGGACFAPGAQFRARTDAQALGPVTLQ